MDDLSQRFGLAVRRLRASHGWSQEELAGRSDLNRSYVGEIERGATMPSLGTAAKLAAALQVRISTLVAGCEAPGPEPEPHPVCEQEVSQF
jgi:transcriptional regulator with XRE-family HTH domain